mgnify:CR=1 FL=1
MMKRIVQYLPILAVAIGCLSFPYAVDASVQVRYNMLDYPDPFGIDPNIDPLDKGFAISGHLIVELPSYPPDPNPLGFTEDQDPFVAWNITLEVRNDSGPNEKFTLTQDNSAWTRLNDGTLPGFFFAIGEPFVSIFDNQQFSDPDYGNNTLILRSESLNQEIDWDVRYGGDFTFTAGPLDEPATIYGSYFGTGDDRPIAVFDSVVPEPSTIAIWSLLGICIGGGVWWRRGKA